ncbi:DMT family transporter [Pelagibacterium xiamenense]|uniref:DMT family transporter n=1 Tax=Pelagibacterium xiamenense TaxID=2901140 RepID=UPI001E4CF8E2|nr:DMT family transporter [Pelagibacterium xiamenense]MCD7059978.1 DMT family transporter [Pelagibacterium xiamenense]
MTSSSSAPAPEKTYSPESGMAFMIAAVLLVPISDAMSKSLTGVLSPFEIAFWRFGFQMLVLGLFVVVMRRRLARGPWHLMVMGGLTMAMVLSSLIGAFVTMPIATAIAIFFVEPLILTVLSSLLLGEKTGWRRYAAVVVGLTGAVIVIRPSWDIFGWASLLPLVAATGFASNAIVIRKLSRSMDAISIQFWFSLIAMAIIGTGLLVFGHFELISLSGGFDPQGPWGQLFFMGMWSGFTFFLFAEAFRRAPASTLAPFQYLEIIGATIVGYVVFGDFPDLWTWVGTAIIFASGLYVFQRERKQGRIDRVEASGRTE